MIDQLIRTHANAIDDWFAKKWQGLTPLPYFSCDIRHSAHKSGVVDTNLFPAGFNNLCNAFTRKTAKAINDYLATFHPGARNIALLAEAHTRNKFYLYNVLKIQDLIRMTDRECRIVMPLKEIAGPKVTISLDSGHSLDIYAPVIKENQLILDGFAADLILSNNDFSSGVPQEFLSLQSKIIPHPDLGWYKRNKSNHFRILDALIHEFSAAFSIDPWLINPITRMAENVTEEDLSKLTHTVHNLLLDIQKKYDEHGIQDAPYVFIKNDSGTYGLGIATVFSADELTKMNRKRREKLFTKKGNGQNQRFLIQEGIPTADTYSDFPIEPVIYGIGKNPVGGFFRIHEAKNKFESLNSPGMSFSCLCLHKLDEPHEAAFINCHEKEKLVSVANFLTRFAALAAAMEARKIQTDLD